MLHIDRPRAADGREDVQVLESAQPHLTICAMKFWKMKSGRCVGPSEDARSMLATTLRAQLAPYPLQTPHSSTTPFLQQVPSTSHPQSAGCIPRHKTSAPRFLHAGRGVTCSVWYLGAFPSSNIDIISAPIALAKCIQLRVSKDVRKCRISGGFALGARPTPGPPPLLAMSSNQTVMAAKESKGYLARQTAPASTIQRCRGRFTTFAARIHNSILAACTVAVQQPFRAALLRDLAILSPPIPLAHTSPILARASAVAVELARGTRHSGVASRRASGTGCLASTRSHIGHTEISKPERSKAGHLMSWRRSQSRPVIKRVVVPLCIQTFWPLSQTGLCALST